MNGAIYQRSKRTYFAPAQVTVYLNSYLVEDACLIEYDVKDAWHPHFGHNDKYFRGLSVGQTIVAGNLGIVYRYEGYLRRVIAKALENEGNLAHNIEEVAAMRKGTAQSLDDSVLQQDAAAVLNLLDSAAENSEKSYRAASDFLKWRFWEDEGTANGRSVTPREALGIRGPESDANYADRMKYQNYFRPSNLKTPAGISLKIVHGPEHNLPNPAFTRKIQDVQFTGQSYRANARVPDGNEAVMEIYPFLAKDVIPINPHM